MLLFAIFVAVPLIEIALFIQIGGLIGLWPTLAIVVATAFAGTTIMRAQGRGALSEIRSSFSELQDPSEPLAHGAMILFAGALLLTPGFFTDATGFLLLFPAFRRLVIGWARTKIHIQTFHTDDPAQARPQHDRADVIEGQYEEVVETPSSGSPPPGSSGWTRH